MNFNVNEVLEFCGSVVANTNDGFARASQLEDGFARASEVSDGFARASEI